MAPLTRSLLDTGNASKTNQGESLLNAWCELIS
jgi:hypothetical protein